MKVYCEETAKSLVSMRTRAEMKAGKAPGPGGSLGKLHGAIIARKIREFGLALQGPSSVAWDADQAAGGNWSRTMLTTFSANIAGGTDEIQRNIIGDRVLGLPREPAVDTHLPFRELRVGTQKD